MTWTSITSKPKITQWIYTISWTCLNRWRMTRKSFRPWETFWVQLCRISHPTFDLDLAPLSIKWSCPTSPLYLESKWTFALPVPFPLPNKFASGVRTLWPFFQAKTDEKASACVFYFLLQFTGSRNHVMVVLLPMDISIIWDSAQTLLPFP